MNHTLEIVAMVVALGLALVGIGPAYPLYGGGYREPAKCGPALPRLGQAGPGQVPRRRALRRLIIRPLPRCRAALYFMVVDRVIIDKILVEGSAAVVGTAGRVSRSLQVGDGQRYMAVFAVGVAAWSYLAARPATPLTTLKVTSNGISVDVDARRGGQRCRPPAPVRV